MADYLPTQWYYLVLAVSFVLAVVTAIHAAMTKDEVRAAIGWVGVTLLSPILGPLIYIAAGVNRIRRDKRAQGRSVSGLSHPGAVHPTLQPGVISQGFGRRFQALATLGDNVSQFRHCGGNRIEMLETGDAAYGAMIAAIEGARRSVILESYIFDHDRIGLRLAGALLAAQARGVEVRVLVDAFGARYSRPTILRHLRRAGLRAAPFNSGVLVTLRLPYAHLRTHRKIVVVDGATGFTGGMNIREGFTREFALEAAARDTHFRVTGPVVADLLAIAAADWHFATGEDLDGAAWRVEPRAGADLTAPMLVRALDSGPDADLAANQKVLMGAFSVARHSIRIMSPYFLPDRELTSALTTAARRGVDIRILVPGQNNLVLVAHAMTAQFDQVLRAGCRIWRDPGRFDHSKLLAIDGVWSFVGSSNLDSRSLRLNFETDLEILDIAMAGRIAARIDAGIARSEEVTLEALRARPFPARLRDRILWLGSPYL
ncbi:phospholipase D-like domain-containing protein [Pseudogemmobacter sonorensis]|uniref:phospholipase D-like domain-containing protein n=1 Tax=Pseudogemmobacter sonorensis TaxID=2989681 RepID=UPI0036CE7123